jgi:CheY-like chemotaxis protein
MVAAQPFNYRILIVDDDAVFCEIAEQVLPKHGFEVRVAEDGFEALNMMRSALPDLIVCDLNMPRMSGFELLATVRRRFPQIAVIAASGEFSGPSLPAGVLADVFLEKGTYSPAELVHKIVDLLGKSPLRPSRAKDEFAPLWIPVNERNYYVLTCTNCLRSFPLSTADGIRERAEHDAVCDHCGETVRYYIAAPLGEAAAEKAKL